MLGNYISKCDFDKICRACLKENDEMISIQNADIIKMFISYAEITIEDNDNLPCQICLHCSNKIEEFFKFKNEIQESDRILRQILIDDEKIKWKQEEEQEEPFEIKDELHEDTDDIENPSIQEDATSTDYDSGLEFPNLNIPDPEPSKKDSAWQRAVSLGPDKCDPSTRTCKICNKVLYNVHSLIRHVETHDSNRKHAIVCPICHKGFFEKQHIKNHMLRHKGEARYTCKECEKPFYELNALRVHVKRKHLEIEIKCEECSEIFILIEDLELHMKSHTGQSYQCETCGKIFNYRYRLREHETTHSKERTFLCKLCPKSFKSKPVLKRHYQRCHSGEKKREICKFCGKSVVNLKNHVEIHNNERYKCDQCTQEFTNKYVLEKHVKRKHGNLDETELNPYLCSICGKRSENLANLNRHYLTHSDERRFKCELCEKWFKTNDLRNSHVKYTHNNERNFVCPHCGKCFQTKSVLRKHIRCHTGHRPYECDICGRAFHQNSTLKTHMRVHGFPVERTKRTNSIIAAV